MNERLLHEACDECAELRALLFRRASTREDVVAIATAFSVEAMNIYRELGGNQLVAAQFYALADKFAVKPDGESR